MRRKPHPFSLSFIGSALLFLGCIGSLSQTANGQPSTLQNTDHPAHKYKLEGKVINSLTGEPVPRALVEFTGMAQDATLSGVDGSFHFDAVTEGQIFVSARKPGFFEKDAPPPYSSRRPSTAIPQTGPITLMLVPDSLIYGHVEDTAGEPIENANIRVMHARVQEGRKKWEQVSQGRTDEDGNYRIAGLIHGAYFVSVEANSFFPRNLTDLSKDRRDGYPALVYYPASPDLTSASPVVLAAGQKMELQFSLKREPMFRISGKVSGASGASYVSFQLLEGSGGQLSLVPQFEARDSTFKGIVPAGNYVMRVIASLPESHGRMLTSELPLTVGSDLTGIGVSLAPSTSIPIVVRSEFSKTSPESGPRPNSSLVNVVLHAVEPYHTDAWGNVNANEGDSFKVHEVVPGKYRVEITPIAYDAYVQSATCGAIDLLNEELVVAQGGQSPPIEIVLRDDSGVVTGNLKEAVSGSPASLLIVPQSSTQLPRAVGLYGQETFQLPGLAPGNYMFFAFDSLQGLEYTNTEVLSRYRSKAAQVTISANGKSNLTLELIKTGE